MSEPEPEPAPAPVEEPKEEHRKSGEDAMAQVARRKSIGSQQDIGQSRRKSRASVSSDMRAQDLSRLKVRKPSYGFGGIPGVRPIERTSQLGLEFKRPILTYLPTYQLDSYKKFHMANVLKIVDETLDEEWEGHKYNESESPLLALRLAGDLMRKVKAVGYNRYRIISIVTIGQKRKQSYNNTISFVWDYERDGYVDTHREMNESKNAAWKIYAALDSVSGDRTSFM